MKVVGTNHLRFVDEDRPPDDQQEDRGGEKGRDNDHFDMDDTDEEDVESVDMVIETTTGLET